MHAFVKHVALPALAPAAIVALYFTPVLLFGCVNRGLIAIAVVLGSALMAFVTASFGMRARIQGHPAANWWLLTTIILTLPLVLVLGPLG